MEINIRKDRMTRNERITAIFNRQPLDRIPFHSLSFSFYALNVGYSMADWYSDPKKCFDSIMKTTEEYGWMDWPFIGYAAIGSWEFGGKIKLPTGEFVQAPIIEESPVKTPEDVDKLEIPDVKTAGILPLCMEISKMAQANGEAYWETMLMEGIFTAAANVCGVDVFCKWMIKKPDTAHKLLRIMTDFIVEWAQYNMDTFGPEHLVAGDGEPTASNQVISPKQFKEFAFPYIKEVHEKCLKMGYKHIITHICGEQNKNLEYWAKIPMGDPGIVSVGHEVDLEKISEYYPNDIIMGNIEPAIIQTGTQEEVYEEARKCIEKGRKHKAGFILACGCEFPPAAPKENAWAIMQAISDFGWYE